MKWHLYKCNDCGEEFSALIERPFMFPPYCPNCRKEHTEHLGQHPFVARDEAMTYFCGEGGSGDVCCMFSMKATDETIYCPNCGETLDGHTGKWLNWRAS
jgi:predicted amidophosphoribosyltransferase